MRGASLQGARQTVIQVLQTIERHDLETGSRTLCSAWTYSHDAVPIGLNRQAMELLDLPLRGHGPSLLDQALQTISAASAEHMTAARLRSSRRRDFQASIRTIVIGRMHTSPIRLTDPVALGRLTLVRIDDLAQATNPASRESTPFHRVVIASELGPGDLDDMLAP